MEHLNNQPIVATPAKSLWRYFVEAYTQNYFNFKGRARRREYWGIWFFNFFIAIAMFCSLFYIADTGSSSMILAWIVSLVLWSIVGFFPSASVTVRRLHDKGYSGKWYLGVLLFLTVACLPLLLTLIWDSEVLLFLGWLLSMILSVLFLC